MVFPLGNELWARLRKMKGRMNRQVHPPCSDSSQARSANLLFGSDHRHGLYLACLGELFVFSLRERREDHRLADAGQV